VITRNHGRKKANQSAKLSRFDANDRRIQPPVYPTTTWKPPAKASACMGEAGRGAMMRCAAHGSGISSVKVNQLKLNEFSLDFGGE